MEKDLNNLVSALRDCASGDGERCLKCTYHKASNMPCDNALMTDAANAIEALQAAEPTERQVVDYCHKRCLVVLGADLFHELKASYGKTPKRGEWRLVTPDSYIFNGYRCSLCNELVYGMTNYCPNCGAKMEVQDG